MARHPGRARSGGWGRSCSGRRFRHPHDCRHDREHVASMSLENPSAPPGKSGKYARPELERRFLLAEMLPGKIERTAEITDRYLNGTRLRLRRMTVRTAKHDARVFYKLTQKVPLPQGGPGLITTVYLSEDEHERLAAVPAL